MNGIKKRDAERLLRQAGFELARNSGRHEVWKHPDGRRFPLPRHSEITPGVTKQLMDLLEKN